MITFRMMPQSQIRICISRFWRIFHFLSVHTTTKMPRNIFYFIHNTRGKRLFMKKPIEVYRQNKSFFVHLSKLWPLLDHHLQDSNLGQTSLTDLLQLN
uniref:Ovule protein n=1 Tax=Meloidogyne incognita TaxID=6306 RepID=A0A914LHQ1_MELIC